MGIRATLLALLLATALSGCTPAATGPSGPPSGLPPGLLSTPGNLHDGGATLHASGSVDETLFLDLGPPGSWTPPPGRMALEWIESYATGMTILGRSFAGTARTSPSLIVELRLSDTQFRSDGGQCTVTITRAEPDRVEGRLSCSDLHKEGETIRATGTFWAAA